MRYIGIDLAWGSKNTTGAATLRWEVASEAGAGANVPSAEAGTQDDKPRLAVIDYADDLLTDDSIVEFIMRGDDGGGVIVGIDAPLDVPNLTGERPVEAALRRCFGKHQAGAHPANRTRFKDDIRGERLAKRLAGEHGIINDFQFRAGDTSIRRCVEVFPHPAMVVLFGLEKTLKYKAKPGRDHASRMAEYARYVDGLRSLEDVEPALRVPAWLTVPTDKQGAALKRYEDLLDALMCAYVAAYFGHWGDGERCMVIGDARSGYIVSPVTRDFRACLELPAPAKPRTSPPLANMSAL